MYKKFLCLTLSLLLAALLIMAGCNSGAPSSISSSSSSSTPGGSQSVPVRLEDGAFPLWRWSFRDGELWKRDSGGTLCYEDGEWRCDNAVGGNAYEDGAGGELSDTFLGGGMRSIAFMENQGYEPAYVVDYHQGYYLVARQGEDEFVLPMVGGEHSPSGAYKHFTEPMPFERFEQAVIDYEQKLGTQSLSGGDGLLFE